MKRNHAKARPWNTFWNTSFRGKTVARKGVWRLVLLILGGLFLILNPDLLFPAKFKLEHKRVRNSTTHSYDNSNLVHEPGSKRMLPEQPQEEEEEEPYDPQLWRHLHSYNFQPRIYDWNEKRATWLATHPPLRNGKKRVLLVTGSQPKPCDRPVGTHLLLKAAKNKIDYCRLHDIQLYYNMAHPEPELSGWWVKLSVIRMLMLAHPEMEWIWWVDSDAVFTDLAFEPPFDSYGQYNLVLYGDDHMIYDLKNWKGLNTGDFFIRNCQWSLDLLDAWAAMGPNSVNNEAGTLLSKTLFGRDDWGADDQSAIVYLLVTERKRWSRKVHFETSYTMSGDWTAIAPIFEELMRKFQPGFGDYRCPLITHFAGCQPCGKWSQYDWNECLLQMERSFDFADHQVYQPYGFKISKLGTADLTRVDSTPVSTKMPDWDKQRNDWLKKNPTIRRPQVLLVSGSHTQQCSGGSMATYILLRGMKNKMDYSRLHDIEFFYNSLDLDPDMAGSGWDKIPVIRTLMLSHPEVEWVWWADSDTIFTDLDKELEFEKYQGKNLVLWGNERLVFEIKSPSGLNTGNFLLRNCQWSVDLLDAWAAMGSLSVRKEAGNILSKALTDRPQNLEGDNQSALVYGLVSQKHLWASKVFFESSQIFGSGFWTSSAEKLEEMKSLNHPDRPFVTHFADCNLCESPSNSSQREFSEEYCLKHMERAFDFADDQVLQLYGLQHRQLGSSEVFKISTPDS